jgi:hypothetical protein
MDALVRPSQIPVSVIGKLTALFGVNLVEGVPFAHRLLLTLTLLATILQITTPVEHVDVPGERRSIVAPALETSTSVVLAERRAHELAVPVPESTQVLRDPEIVFEQLD